MIGFIVTLKREYSQINQNIDLNVWETERLTTVDSMISSNFSNIDVERTGAFSPEFSEKIVLKSVEDLTRASRQAIDNGFINQDNFNQIFELELETKGKENVLAAITELEKLDMVLAAEPDYNYDVAYDSFTPNDPMFTQQWGLQKIVAEEAWGITQGNTDIKVGVMEQGVYANHPDLQGRVLSGNFTTPSGADLSHGTHVAGIIGAISNNGVGVAGVAQVSLVPLTSASTNFVNSLMYAAENNIRIINASFRYVRTVNGITVSAPPNTAHANAIKNFNGLLISAAGNNGVNTDVEPQYPAGYGVATSTTPALNNVISVGSTDQTDTRSTSSNFGQHSVHIFAPGTSIQSTYVISMGNSYAYGYSNMSGTSMAAPHVSGVAALILSIDPNMTIDKLRAYILRTADEIPKLKDFAKLVVV